MYNTTQRFCSIHLKLCRCLMDGCDFVTVCLLACFFFHFFRSFVIIFRVSGFLVTKYMHYKVITLMAQFLLQLLAVTRLLHYWRNSSYSC